MYAHFYALKRGDFVRLIITLGDYVQGGFCPGDYVRGIMSRGDYVLHSSQCTPADPINVLSDSDPGSIPVVVKNI